jgi:hypothetical protein
VSVLDDAVSLSTELLLHHLAVLSIHFVLLFKLSIAVGQVNNDVQVYLLTLSQIVNQTVLLAVA